MATETVENYLKAIYTLSAESATGEAAMSRIAALVGVTTGTATTMVKKLAASKLARYERFGGVTLTPAGSRAAINILRRHRIVETFLVQTLKLDWSIVHAEAERLEHAISPPVLEALDEHLGRPAVDPHGDPIPDPSGKLRPARSRPLSECQPGERTRIVRIGNQDPDFLVFIARHALKPGSRLTIVTVEPGAGAITVQPHARPPVTLGLPVAQRIEVEQAAR